MRKTGIFGSVLLLIGVAGIVLNLPDIIRYIKMRMM
jgi:hypothetical protein